MGGAFGERVKKPIDHWLVAPLAFLLALGLVVLYSASSVYAARTYDDAEHFLKAQALYGSLGLVAMVAMMHFPRAILQRRAGWLLLGSVILCGLVLIPGIGHWVGGARRWLDLGPVVFQPSEVAKVSVVILLAALLSQADTSKRLWVPALLTQIPVGLVLLEPDFGTAVVMELLLVTMIFCAGMRLRTLVFGALCAMPLVYHLIVGTPFRLRRIMSFIDPWAYRSTVGYQVTEALISIGSGGLLGVGLGESKQKLFFLPEAHTDFIFAILAEELGLVGVCLMLLAFAVLLGRGWYIARRASSTFDKYLALGITAMIGIPALLNVCVATGLLPTKGLPLPLISYGGTHLVCVLGAFGLLLQIARDVGTKGTAS